MGLKNPPNMLQAAPKRRLLVLLTILHSRKKIRERERERAYAIERKMNRRGERGNKLRLRTTANKLIFFRLITICTVYKYRLKNNCC
jgi:hypothetical protein